MQNTLNDIPRFHRARSKCQTVDDAAQLRSGMASALSDTGNTPASSLASRRRRRYRSLRADIRRVSPEDAIVDTPARQVESPTGDHIEPDEKDNTTDADFIHLRRLSKRAVSRSAFDYLLLEGQATTASLLCRAVTTAEQEIRTKTRARVWRHEVTKVKARHLRQLPTLEDQSEDATAALLQLHQTGCAGMLASRLCQSEAQILDNHEADVIQLDAHADGHHEQLLG